MPQGDKTRYTDKQKRQAAHIEAGYEPKGLSTKTAAARAWATVNKLNGGGKKSGAVRRQAKDALGGRSQMSRVTPQMRKFAERLMANEAVGNVLSRTKTPAGFYVSEKLQMHLAIFMGYSGFHTLVARSLALSSAELPWLRTVRVKADGSLEGVEELQAQLDPDAFFDGKVVLLARLLGLLVAFIGENLTLRLVREVWPNVPLKGLDLGTGGKNKKTK